MADSKLDPNSLEVTSFATVGTATSLPGYCCTGCVSGCGINPTAGGCASGSGDVLCPPADMAL